MARNIPIKRNLKELRPVIAAACALGVIVAWLLFGSTGVFAWSDYSNKLELRRAELVQLQVREAALENRQKLLDPRHVDPDLVDELVRSELVLLHPDDVVVPLR